MEVKAPEKNVMLDVALTDGRLVVVGERGIIVYSDDAGETWRQARVPVSVSLTAVRFAGPKTGWAVGHGGVVLHTTDGGETWELQMEGTAAAGMALENAEAMAARMPDDYDAQQMVNNAFLLVEDGPDKPFLDLYFKNDREGFIVGSYGLVFKTEDGGESWKCLMDSVENPGALNLYAIHAAGDDMYIAGEQGLFLVSRDGGQSFRQVQTPYFGTFFSVYAYPSGELVLAGLQGNAFWSEDHGQTFTASKVDIPVSFSKVVACAHDVLLFANQGGMLLESRDRGKTIHALDVRLNPVSSLVQMPSEDHENHVIMTAGYGGAVRVQLPSKDAGDKGGQQ
jgi:photosystem II stability/assembly factor-like uncharacterized protein